MTATRSTGVLALPEFRALLGARLTNALGMSALATVVAFQTYEVTRNPLALGLLGLVEAVPALGLMLVGGHLAAFGTLDAVDLLWFASFASATAVLAAMTLRAARTPIA